MSSERGPRAPRVALGAPGAMLVIISGPSGVGKDTIIAALRRRSRDPDYHYVVTCTTRGPRPGGVDGVSYHFLETGALTALRAGGGDGGSSPFREPGAFAARRDGGELLEWAEVHGNWYGTPRRQVVDALRAGRDVILKIDVQGAQAGKSRVPPALLVFRVPPSMEALFSRPRSRATETADELEVRQRNAAIELARQEDYDHVVVNETGPGGRPARRRGREGGGWGWSAVVGGGWPSSSERWRRHRRTWPRNRSSSACAATDPSCRRCSWPSRATSPDTTSLPPRSSSAPCCRRACWNGGGWGAGGAGRA